MGTPRRREMPRPRWVSVDLLLLTCFAYLLLGNGPVLAKSQLEHITESKHDLKPTDPAGGTQPATQPPQGFTEPHGPQETPQEPHQVTEGGVDVATALPQGTSVSVPEPGEPTVPSTTVPSKTKRSTTRAITTQAPTTQAPTTQGPMTRAITTQAPTTQAPTTQAPTTQAPTTQAPTTQAPTTQAPTTQAPTTQAPTTQAPSTQEPSTQAPTTQAPTTQAPTTQAPTTQAPTTQAPTTQAPSTQEPSTQAPTTQAPTTQAPTTEAPTTEAPTTEAPTTEAPTTEATTTEAPTTAKLTSLGSPTVPTTTLEQPQITHQPPSPPPDETPEPQPTPHWPLWPTMPVFPTEEPNPPIQTKKLPPPTKPNKPTGPHNTEPPHRTQPPRPTDHPRSTKLPHPTVASQGTTQNTQHKTPMPYPTVFVQLFLQALWQDLCPNIQGVLASLSKYSKKVLQLSYSPTIKALNDTTECLLDVSVQLDIPVGETRVQLDLCLLAKTGMCDPLLTQRLGIEMQLDKAELQTYLRPEVLAVQVYGKSDSTTGPQESSSSATAIGVALSVTFLLGACVGAIIFHKLYRNRMDKRRAMHIHYYCDGKSHDGLSESHQLSPLHKTTFSIPDVAGHQLVPAINEGLVMDDEDIDTQNYPSHVLSMHGLSQFHSYLEAIIEEFETLPDFQSSPTRPRTSSKSRTPTSPNLFMPPSKTRVSLQKASSDNQHGFLNASFIKGYGKAKYSYIATTAPWGTNLADFWEMVWEQQSRTIICLCSPEEMGVVCPWYWPRDEGIQSAQLYGDILIMRQGCIVTENYCMSTLLIKNIQNSLCRPVNHFWFTQWSPVSTAVPSRPTVLLSFLLQVRQTVQETYGPIVVHCSDGCSRTGTLLAIDSAMRSMEDLCTVNVPSIVCCVRRDRGAAVLERNHYAFIYKVLYEYSIMLTRGLADGMAAEEEEEMDAEASIC